ncbi:MAG: DUF58 domain-containing protein [Gallionellaceae bacterium]|nr:DUF58 domain-containing protein [Gallionellaceae bacterium]
MNLPFRRGGAGRAAHPTSPLLAADEIAQLAAQAELLGDLHGQREVHDHHAGDWPSAWLGRGLDYEESRPYAAGDDIRDMDWRTTARGGRAFLKIYREERQPILHLAVDRGASLRFGTRRRLKAAQAARVAILLAFAAAQDNTAVGATLWDRHDLELPPLHGRAGALALAEAIAAPCPPLPQTTPTEPLRDLDRLAWLDANLPRGARLVLVSDFAWLETSHEAPLARLAERLDVLAARISDPAERALPDLGLACFHDSSKQGVSWLDTRQPGHAERLRQQLNQRAERLARAGIRLIDIASEVDDLLPLLAHHA